MSLLSIVQNVWPQTIGGTQPSSVINSADGNIVLMRTLANRIGYELMARYPWEALTKEASHTAISGQDQGTLISIASDYHRMRSRTLYDRTTSWRIEGAISPAIYQRLKSTLTVSPFNVARIRGGRLLMIPAPTVGNTISFEYITTKWCTSSDGATERTAFAADTDVTKLPEYLFELGLIYRWKARHELDYAEDMREYEKALAEAQLAEAPKRRVRMDGKEMTTRAQVSVPDGSWSVEP